MKTQGLPHFNLFASLATAALLFFISSCKDDESPSSAPPDDIAIKSMSPESPAVLKYYETGSNDRVNIKYDYNIVHDEGARIWIQPYTDGDPSPGYLYSSSDVFKGKGSRSVLVSIDEDAGSTNVDQLRIIIKNPDQSLTITERTVDVDYTFE